MRVYTVEHEIAQLNPSAGDGLLVIRSPLNMVVQVISTQVKNVDNDTHEQLWFATTPVNAAGSIATSGTAPTPRKHDPGDPASSVTVYVAGSGGLGTEPTSWGEPYNESGDSNINGYLYEPPFDARPIIGPSGFVGVRMMAAPSTAFTGKVSITYGEIGG